MPGKYRRTRTFARPACAHFERALCTAYLTSTSGEHAGHQSGSGSKAAARQLQAPSSSSLALSPVWKHQARSVQLARRAARLARPVGCAAGAGGSGGSG